MSNLSTCELCAPGKYQADSGEETCDTCKKGHYCPAGAAAVTPCPAGYYNPNPGAANITEKDNSLPQCRPCTPGHECPAGSIEQVPCEPGSYTNENKSSECSKCETQKP